ncbi:MAG: hypothetical protein ABUT20_43195 [Bacteroidota bacterium]
MYRWFHLIVGLILISCGTANGQKAEIYGKWYFDRFGGPHGEISKDAEITKANKQNEGMSFTFRTDDKAVIQQKNGASMTAPFQLLAGRKEIVLQRDTMRIMLLTSDILELYPISEEKPAMFLKRSKEGKTAMSAQ